ncbi:MAG TPA: VWA domain-containing protein [Blastocatellia bacterium]|nr:VWA domain-containing protein [Blastocatellia bacterium]
MRSISFLEIPHRRDYLLTTIGKRLRNRFARDKSTALPPIDLIGPHQVPRGCPPTGWYHYGTGRITAVVDPERPAKREWIWATLVIVHEHLHWLWNFVPKAFGLQTALEYRIWNVMLDCSNEQRAIIEDGWSRRILKRGRALILQEQRARWEESLRRLKAKGVPVTSSDPIGRIISMGLRVAPLYEAGDLVLGCHTVLAAKGHNILRRLYKDRVDSTELWGLLEQEVGPPSENIARQWPEAFTLALDCWRARNEFKRAEIVREFINLFPPPAPDETEPSGGFDVGGHMGAHDQNPAQPKGAPGDGAGREGGSNAGAPQSDEETADSDPGGDSSGENKEGGCSASDGDPDEGDGQQGSEDPDGSDSPNGASSEEAGEAGGEGSQSQNRQAGSSSSACKPSDHSSEKPSADSGNGQPSSGPLSFDPADSAKNGAVQDPVEPDDDPDDVQRETQELQKEGVPWCPGGRYLRGADRVVPAVPTGLIRDAQPYANELRSLLKLASVPRSIRRDDKGRVIARIVARAPDAARPFRNFSRVEKGLAPTVFIWAGLDSSGSMKLRSKWVRAQVACMAVSLACDATGVRYVITMSRTNVQLAGEGVKPERGRCLIAGADHHQDGDNYVFTLPSVSERILKRTESVRVAILITDGEPCGPREIKAEVDKLRARGIIVIGVGLDLEYEEAEGLKRIFGEKGCVFTLNGETRNFAILLSQALNAAVQKGVRETV